MHAHSKHTCHCDGHDLPNHPYTPQQKQEQKWRLFLPAILSFSLLLIGLYIDYYQSHLWMNEWIRISWYVMAYLMVGSPVIHAMYKAIRQKEVFSEFSLMVIATLGAFCIKDYPEAVGVMLFYTVGETIQGLAVRKARKNIQVLLDQRPETVRILTKEIWKDTPVMDVPEGSIMQIKPGEKIALDGILLSDEALLNPAALTGESKLLRKKKGESILAGMVNRQSLITVQSTAPYNNSKLAQMLELIQTASTRKAPTELFIRKFAKVYTPIVVGLAFLITMLPFFFDASYVFKDYLYKALVFLVISCPCALVISVPLSYFGGIGSASKQGILIKGGNYLDALAQLSHLVMDKTGTLTEGTFSVQAICIFPSEQEAEILAYVHAVESKSTHPIAMTIALHTQHQKRAIPIAALQEIPGMGIEAKINDKHILLGNAKLLKKHHIAHASNVGNARGTIVFIAINGTCVGYIELADQVKSNAKYVVNKLHQMGIHTTILSGDKQAITTQVASLVGIKNAYGDLLPESKLEKFTTIKQAERKVGFVGDGMNDAAVVAQSDVGIAMGGLGSDATIEFADVVIQDDNLSKIPVAIEIATTTRQIVLMNIIFALTIKVSVMILGLVGLSSMWMAIFADVGVAILAVINATRILYKKF